MFKIAVASGKVGTGKTFIATNIYYSLQQQNQRVMLADCDAEAPNAIAFFNAKLMETSEVTQEVPVINHDVCTFCGRCRDYCNYNAIFILPPMKIINVIEDLCHGCGACSVACKAGAISEKPVTLGKIDLYSLNGVPALIEARMNIGVMSPVSIIKAAVRKVDHRSDVAILDAPPGTSCPFIQTVSASDYVILVTEPTPFGLSDLKQSVETLKIIKKPFGVIINRTGSGYKDVHNYLWKEKIPLLLEIPFKKETAILYSTGKLLARTDPFFAEQLTQVIKNILSNHGNSNSQR